MRTGHDYSGQDLVQGLTPLCSRAPVLDSPFFRCVIFGAPCVVLWWGLNLAASLGIWGKILGAGQGQLLPILVLEPLCRNYKVFYDWYLPVLGLEVPGRGNGVN